ncbi:MAG: sulfotransferase family protein, partial [Caulobacterales bacterium]
DFSRRLDEAAAHFEAGRLDAAAQIYRKLDRLAPDDVRAASADLALPPDIRAGLFFAIGEVLEQRKSPTEAFEAYAAGNRLQRAILDQTSPPAQAAAANAAAVRYACDLFTPALIASRSRAGRPEAPIFIVGMPRSGSTLIEQILASHPEVQGLGETAVLPRLLTSGYPDTAAGYRDLGGRYLAALRDRGWDGASRFVDKTLENYLHLGAIRLAFPGAVILHAVRDPVDTGFACYRRLFARGNETLYDLAEIGAEYQRYRAMMAHWAQVLPAGFVDVGYEALVADPDARIRWLVTESAGLEWDPACLKFFEREGAVVTASASQVRRPIFKDGLQRWRRHAANLAPLIEALGPYAPAD